MSEKSRLSALESLEFLVLVRLRVIFKGVPSFWSSFLWGLGSEWDVFSVLCVSGLGLGVDIPGDGVDASHGGVSGETGPAELGVS